MVTEPATHAREPNPTEELVADVVPTLSPVEAVVPEPATAADAMQGQIAPEPDPVRFCPPAPQPGPQRLEADLRDLILEEAKEQYKKETDRNNQSYTRSGIYLAILAVYVNALIRFVDNPPPKSLFVAYCFFIGFCCLFSICLITSFQYIVRVLVPKTAGFPPLPSEWIDYLSVLRAYYINNTDKTLVIGQCLEADLKESMLLKLSESIDNNFKANNVRVYLLFKTGLSIAVGLALLIISMSLYAILVIQAPSTAKITPVRIIDPIQLLKESTLADPARTPPPRTPQPAAPAPPVQAESPSQPAPPVQPASAEPNSGLPPPAQSSTKPPPSSVEQFQAKKPEPPRVHYLREGQDPKVRR